VVVGMSARVVALVKLLDETLTDIQGAKRHAITNSEYAFWRALHNALPALREIADHARLEQAEAAVTLLRCGATEIPAGG
jgi:DNA-binding MarR family transcriptional regulator